jgi:hypothetical protein
MEAASRLPESFRENNRNVRNEDEFYHRENINNRKTSGNKNRQSPYGVEKNLSNVLLSFPGREDSHSRAL